MKKIIPLIVIFYSAYTAQAQNVGIGILSPNQKLHVAGNINMLQDSNIRINNIRVLSNKGDGNLFTGGYAGINNTSGVWNFMGGADAGFSNTTGSYNTFVGAKAGFNNSEGLRNVFIGVASGLQNTTGKWNNFIGTDAGHENTTGSSNVFIGFETGYLNTTGSANLFAGNLAGRANTTGQENVFLGPGSGFTNTLGSSNTFVGKDAGYSNTTAHNNTFIGRAAGGANSSGEANTFSGTAAGELNVTGNSNTFYGYRTGRANTIGNNNTLIGANAELSSNNLDNATAVGANAIVGASNSLVLGKNANVGIGTSAPTAKLDVQGLSSTGFQHLRLTETEDDFARMGYHSTASTKYWETVAKPSNDNATAIYNIFNSSSGNLFTVKGDAKVGINNDNPSTTLDVNGFTKLGELSPQIKMKKISGTTAATEGGIITVAHGIADISKILSVDLLVTYAGSNTVHHSYTFNPGYECNFYITPAVIFVTNNDGNSFNILSKSFRLLITYEQ